MVLLRVRWRSATTPRWCPGRGGGGSHGGGPPRGGRRAGDGEIGARRALPARRPPAVRGAGMMSTLHKEGEGVVAFKEGASMRCVHGMAITGPDSAAVLAEVEALASEGLRVLAFGVRRFPSIPDPLTPEEVERDLTFVGLAGLHDRRGRRRGPPSRSAPRRDPRGDDFRRPSRHRGRHGAPARWSRPPMHGRHRRRSSTSCGSPAARRSGGHDGRRRERCPALRQADIGVAMGGAARTSPGRRRT